MWHDICIIKAFPAWNRQVALSDNKEKFKKKLIINTNQSEVAIYI